MEDHLAQATDGLGADTAPLLVEQSRKEVFSC
jgi:hypothetical protein